MKLERIPWKGFEEEWEGQKRWQKAKRRLGSGTRGEGGSEDGEREESKKKINFVWNAINESNTSYSNLKSKEAIEKRKKN